MFIQAESSVYCVCVGVVGHWEDTEPTEMKTDALFLTLSVFNSVVTLLLNPTNDTQDFGCFFFLFFVAFVAPLASGL